MCPEGLGVLGQMDALTVKCAPPATASAIDVDFQHESAKDRQGATPSCQESLTGTHPCHFGRAAVVVRLGSVEGNRRGAARCPCELALARPAVLHALSSAYPSAT